jgi:hypothetical protein
MNRRAIPGAYLFCSVPLHLEVNEEDVEELVQEHSKDLTTEDLEEMKKQLNQERERKIKSAYQRRRTAIKREECQ